MLKNILLLFAILIMMISGCVQDQGASSDWVFYFVKWNEETFVVTNQEVSEINQLIGAVEKFSDREDTYSGVFSNTFPVGTKLYSLKNVDEKKAIAAQFGGKFIVLEHKK